MARSFWFAITVLTLVCFLSAAVDWLAHPPAAMAAPPTGAPAEVEQREQSLNGSSPVIQVAVAVVSGLFMVLSMALLIEEKEKI